MNVLNGQVFGFTDRLSKLYRVIIYLVLAIIIITSIALSSVFISKANDRTDKPEMYKYYKSVLIYYGDTLDTLAMKYTDGSKNAVKEFYKDVYFTNHLVCDKINPGDYIVIPYYSDVYK